MEFELINNTGQQISFFSLFLAQLIVYLYFDLILIMNSIKFVTRSNKCFFFTAQNNNILAELKLNSKNILFKYFKKVNKMLKQFTLEDCI